MTADEQQLRDAATEALSLAWQAAGRAGEHHPQATTDALASIALSLAVVAAEPEPATASAVEPRPPLVGNPTYDPCNGQPCDVVAVDDGRTWMYGTNSALDDEPWVGAAPDGSYRGWCGHADIPADAVLIARGGRPVVPPRDALADRLKDVERQWDVATAALAEYAAGYIGSDLATKTLATLGAQPVSVPPASDKTTAGEPA